MAAGASVITSAFQAACGRMSGEKNKELNLLVVLL
jgi:hypothetical protein